jgi:NitT/TauT family transport system substrate-binding protein
LKRLLAVLFAAAMILAACGNDDDAGDGNGNGAGAPDTDSPSEPDDDDADDDAPDDSYTASFRIAFPGEPGFASLPVLTAIDRLNAEGWDIEVVGIADTSVMTEALLSGEIQIAVANINETANVAQRGQPLAIVGLRNAQDWIVVSKDDIQTCDDMTGRRVAYHSESAASAHMLRNWIAEECGAEPDWLVMAGSTNRAAALQAGQIDATILKLEDWLPLGDDQGNIEGAHIMADMASAMPDLTTSTYAVDRRWIESDREAVVRFLAEAIRATREVGENPDILWDAIEIHIEGEDEVILGLLMDQYIERGYWSATEDGGLDETKVQYTIDFLTSTEVIDPGLTVDELADLDVLREALARLDS